MTTVRPTDFVLGPATRLLWRSPDSVHLELGDRAVVVEGLPARVIGAVAMPDRPRRRGGRARPGGDPTRADAAHTDAAPDAPVGPAEAEVLTGLAEAGFLWSRRTDADDTGDPYGSPDDRRLPPAPRLAGELTSLAARHGERAAQLLEARRYASVLIEGNGRCAPQLAALLAAAGVGRVHCAATGTVRLCHVSPGGVQLADEGSGLAAAAEAAVHRVAPDADTARLAVSDPPDLCVLVVDGPVGSPVDDDRRAVLHEAGATHLVLTVGVDNASIGPLVVPGLTSCLRCADLHRRDRDPLWAALAVQLAVGRRYGPTSDVAVAATAVGAAAIQILTFLDAGDPACIEGTLELHLPDWRLRRRSRPVHDDCGCCGR